MLVCVIMAMIVMFVVMFFWLGAALSTNELVE
jgi:hypothetical protein